jgi:hypothetical protein
LNIFAVQVQPRIRRNDFGSPGDLEHIVKSDAAETGENIADIVQVIKLTVQGRCRKSDCILVIFQTRKRIVDSFFGFMRADTDTLPAVDAPHGTDNSASIADADCFRGAAFQTGCTSFAFTLIEGNGMFICIHITPAFRLER